MALPRAGITPAPSSPPAPSTAAALPARNVRLGITTRPMIPPSTSAERELLDRIEEAGAGPHDRAGQLEAGHSGDEDFEDGPQLDAGEGGAEAEVGAEAE